MGGLWLCEQDSARAVVTRSWPPAPQRRQPHYENHNQTADLRMTARERNFSCLHFYVYARIVAPMLTTTAARRAGWRTVALAVLLGVFAAAGVA